MKKIIFIVVLVATLTAISILFWNYQETEKAKIVKESQSWECSLSPDKEGRVIISGKVNFPKGVKNRDQYKVVLDLKEYEISPRGEFCAYGRIEKDVVLLLGVASPNKEDFALAAVVIPEDSTNIIVNAKSTAIGIIFTPLFLSPWPNEARENIQYIEANPKFPDFVKAIEETEILFSSDLEEGGKLYKPFMDVLNSFKEENVQTKQSEVINFEMSIEPVNYHKAPKGDYLNGRITKLDENAQAEFEKHYITKFFISGSEIGVTVTSETKISGTPLSEGYNSLRADIKGYVENVDDVDTIKFLATEVFVY